MTSAGHEAAAGGAFTLGLGILATVLGGLLVMDFRGFARWFLRGTEASSAGPRRLPPWRRRPERPERAGMLPLVRVVGGIFAAAGLVMLVLGIVLLSGGEAGAPFTRDDRFSGPVAFVYPVMAAVWLRQFWRPGGLLATTWNTAGPGRHILPVLRPRPPPAPPPPAGYVLLGSMALTALGLSTVAMMFSRTRRDDGQDPAVDGPPTASSNSAR
ncbi:hypothetical protein [Kitasatospora sp. NPDC087315]|uniref:hypothetical protein n=1 Tax=Kitasatospora sp. NPDC087315 TaxID=3364069 RepID=UPI0038245FB7